MTLISKGSPCALLKTYCTMFQRRIGRTFWNNKLINCTCKTDIVLNLESSGSLNMGETLLQERRDVSNRLAVCWDTGPWMCVLQFWSWF